MPQGHPDYRFICQEMWRKIREVHPALAETGKFIDWRKYRLGRLQSKMRTEFKNSARLHTDAMKLGTPLFMERDESEKLAKRTFKPASVERARDQFVAR